jgi:4-amino-4-deoxy-L-arabinose transferase-like glycosyltransferase
MILEKFRADPPTLTLFISICGAGFLMRLACTTGLIGSDDLAYAHFARLIANFQYAPESIHYALRYGLTIPQGIIYRLAGVHEWTTFVLPLFASTASIPLLMIVGARLAGPRAALLAGILLASFTVSLRYATILVPEPVAGFYILLAVLLYLESDNRRPLVLGACAGLILGLAYLTKESAAFVGLAVFLDAALRRKWAAACGMAAGALAIVAIEHAYYLAATGDLFYRMHAMKIHEQSAMVLGANRNLSYRLFKSYPRMMLFPSRDFGVHSIFAAFATLSLFLWRPARGQLLLLWTAVPLLYLNFGSSSLTHFTALPVADRYIEFIYAPLFVLVGAVLDHYIELRPWTARPVVACVATVVAAGLWCGYATRQTGWRIKDVAILRQIADDAGQKQIKKVHFVGDTDGRWEEEIGILAPRLQTAVESAEADLVIGPDAMGLPSSVSVSGAVQKSLP